MMMMLKGYCRCYWWCSLICVLFFSWFSNLELFVCLFSYFFFCCFWLFFAIGHFRWWWWLLSIHIDGTHTHTHALDFFLCVCVSVDYRYNFSNGFSFSFQLLIRLMLSRFNLFSFVIKVFLLSSWIDMEKNGNN